MKGEYIFPTVLIALDVAAAMPYAVKANWRNHDGLRAALGKDEFDWAKMPYTESEAGK